MLILRFPHSFGVWGCWARSNSIHFANFRALGRSWMGHGWVRAESCPILGGSRKCSDNIVNQFKSQPLHESLQNCLRSLLWCIYVVATFLFFRFFSFLNYFFNDFHKNSQIIWHYVPNDHIPSISATISSHLREEMRRKSQKYIFRDEKIENPKM